MSQRLLPAGFCFSNLLAGDYCFLMLGALSIHRHASQVSNATALPKVCWPNHHLDASLPLRFSCFWPTSSEPCCVFRWVLQPEQWGPVQSPQGQYLTLHSCSDNFQSSSSRMWLLRPAYHLNEEGPLLPLTTEGHWNGMVCLSKSRRLERAEQDGGKGWGADGHHRGKPGKWEREYS